MKKMKIKKPLALLLSGAFLMLNIVPIEASVLEKEEYFKTEAIQEFKLKPGESFKPQSELEKRFEEEKITRKYKVGNIEEVIKKEKKTFTEKVALTNLADNLGTGIEEKMDSSKFLTISEYKGTMAKNSITYEPINSTRYWKEQRIDSISRSYSLLAEAEFTNIPKEVSEGGFTWYLLTDGSSFNWDSSSKTYNCDAVYSKVTDVPQSEQYISGYNAVVTYVGELEKDKEKIVTVTYKLTEEKKDVNNLPKILAVAGTSTGGLVFLLYRKRKRKTSSNL